MDQRAGAGCNDGNARVGDGIVHAHDVERLGALLVHRLADVVRRRPERERRVAVDAHVREATRGRAGLEAQQPQRRERRQSRPGDEERVGDPPDRRPAAQDEEPVVVAGGRDARGARGDADLRDAARRDADRRRDLEGCADAGGLRPHLDVPDAGSAAGVRDGDEPAGPARAGAHVEVAERERHRVGEDERVVGCDHVHEPGCRRAAPRLPASWPYCPRPCRPC